MKTPTNHIWMKTRDFQDSEHSIFKVMEFIYIYIYIYSYLLCFYAHLWTLIKQEALMEITPNFHKIIFSHWTTSRQNSNVTPCSIIKLLGFLFDIFMNIYIYTSKTKFHDSRIEQATALKFCLMLLHVLQSIY